MDKALQDTAVVSKSSSASVPPLTFLQPALIRSSTMSTFHFCAVFEQRRPILSRPTEGKKKQAQSLFTSGGRWPHCHRTGPDVKAADVLSRSAEVTMAERFGGVRLPAGAPR